MTDDAGGFIRPFVITGGRTEVHHTEVRLDTLLSALPGRAAPHQGFEHRAVLGLCRQPTSIAEIATALDLPVGVIGVVVDDLLEADLVLVHHNKAATVSVSVLERILDGVRAL